MTFIVYTVQKPSESPATADIYIGYGTGLLADCKMYFIDSLKRPDDRGSKRLCDTTTDPATLIFTTVASYEDELEAFLKRNEMRAESPFAVTGPSMYPASMHERANHTDAKRNNEIASRYKQRTAKTARDAYVLGAYTYGQLQQLAAIHTSDAVKSDLDACTPAQFFAKYSI